MLARRIVIGFGVALVFPLLVYYGVAIVSSPPRYQELYLAAQSLTPDATPEQRKAYQDERDQRQQAFDRQAEAFSLVLISVATPLRIAAVLIGGYLPQQAIGTGLMLGGVLTVADGYWTYWQHLPEWLRFLSLLLGFVVLLSSAAAAPRLERDNASEARPTPSASLESARRWMDKARNGTLVSR